MSNFDTKNVIKLTKFELNLHKKIIIGWSIALFSLMFLYMILFGSMQEMAQVKMEAMPEELLQFVGMSSFDDMSNYISYFGMIFNLVLIAISIFAATFGANLLFKEEKSKSIEFLYSLEVSRSEIYFSKLITGFIGLMAVIIATSIAATICGFIAGETFILMDFIAIIKLSSFTPFFFLGVAFMFSGISNKISSAMISSVTVLGCYMLGYLGNLLGDKATWLRYLSPFESFSPTNAIALEGKTMITMGIYFVILVLFVIVGHGVYRKRDLNV